MKRTQHAQLVGPMQADTIRNRARTKGHVPVPRAIVGMVICADCGVVLAVWGILQPHVTTTGPCGSDQRAGRAVGHRRGAETGRASDTFVLPGNVTAFTDSPIYARTSGYLTKWYFDIGSRVKKGASAGRDCHSGTRSATGAGAS